MSKPCVPPRSLIILRVKSNRLEDVLPLVPGILTALTTIKMGDTVQLGG